MLRRVHRESAVALSGPRALLMQAAHPVAFAGFFANTGSLDEPYERLARTAQRDGHDRLRDEGRTPTARRAACERCTRRVHGVTAEPAGRFPAGTPYAADDPELLLWILACLVDSALVVYAEVRAHAEQAERDAYWQRLPRDRAPVRAARRATCRPRSREFDAYMRGMLDGGDLYVTPAARELAIQIVMRPPVPLAARPLLELANQITVGLLPRDIRRQYGLRWDPARAVALHGGAEYVKRVVVPLLPDRVRLTPRARAA